MAKKVGRPSKKDKRQAAEEARARKFVAAYVANGFRGKAAAIEAGYGKGYAKNAATRILKTDYAKQLLSEYLKDERMTAEEVLFMYTKLARGSIKPFLKIVGGSAFIDLSKATDDDLYLIKRLTRHETDGGTVNVGIEIEDRQKALEQLGKFYNLFIDKKEVTARLSITGLEDMLNKVYGITEDDDARED